MSASHVPGYGRAPMSDPLLKMRVEESEKPKHIAQINFGLLSGPDMVRMSHLRVCNHELYQINTRIPTKYGCLDTRLGISDKVGVGGGVWVGVWGVL